MTRIEKRGNFLRKDIATTSLSISDFIATQKPDILEAHRQRMQGLGEAPFRSNTRAIVLIPIPESIERPELENLANVFDNQMVNGFSTAAIFLVNGRRSNVVDQKSEELKGILKQKEKRFPTMPIVSAQTVYQAQNLHVVHARRDLNLMALDFAQQLITPLNDLILINGSSLIYELPKQYLSGIISTFDMNKSTEMISGSIHYLHPNFHRMPLHFFVESFRNQLEQRKLKHMAPTMISNNSAIRATSYLKTPGFTKDAPHAMSKSISHYFTQSSIRAITQMGYRSYAYRHIASLNQNDPYPVAYSHLPFDSNAHIRQKEQDYKEPYENNYISMLDYQIQFFYFERIIAFSEHLTDRKTRGLLAQFNDHEKTNPTKYPHFIKQNIEALIHKLQTSHPDFLNMLRNDFNEVAQLIGVEMNWNNNIPTVGRQSALDARQEFLFAYGRGK